MAVLTDTGRKWIIDKMRESIAAGVLQRNVAWGTGAGAEARTNTALTTEAPEARTVGTITSVQTTVAGDTHRTTGTITATAARTITEVGVFDSATAASGVMLIRALFTGIPLSTGDSIAFTLDFQQT